MTALIAILLGVGFVVVLNMAVYYAIRRMQDAYWRDYYHARGWRWPHVK